MKREPAVIGAMKLKTHVQPGGFATTKPKKQQGMYSPDIHKQVREACNRFMASHQRTLSVQ